MYSKIKKTAITLFFLIGLSTTNYAATKTTKLLSPLSQPAKDMSKRLPYQLLTHRQTIGLYSPCASISLPGHKCQSQPTYSIGPSAKVSYTGAFGLHSPWALLGTAGTKKSNRARMHLKYKLGISASIASVITIHLYFNQAEASGYRGNGYRPYDCRFRKEFKRQAQEALEKAKEFKQLYHTKKLDKKTIDMLGTSALVALLWAQDQGEYLLTKHYGGYFCHVMRWSTCYYYENNKCARDKYHYKLEKEIESIRDLLGVPQTADWESQVEAFLYGGAKAQALAISAKVLAIIPGVNLIALGVGTVHVAKKTADWIDKNMVNPGKGLAEEEKYIKQALFVRALCADEYSITQAQNWGGFVVTSILAAESVSQGDLQGYLEGEGINIIQQKIGEIIQENLPRELH